MGIICPLLFEYDPHVNRMTWDPVRNHIYFFITLEFLLSQCHFSLRQIQPKQKFHSFHTNFHEPTLHSISVASMHLKTFLICWRLEQWNENMVPTDTAMIFISNWTTDSKVRYKKSMKCFIKLF
jgi:hypothetical protein